MAGLRLYRAPTSGGLMALSILLGLCSGLASVVSGTASQSDPVWVGQVPEGTVYVIQDAAAWPLQPDPITDAEVDGLTVHGEIDRALPDDLLQLGPLLKVVQTSA